MGFGWAAFSSLPQQELQAAGNASPQPAFLTT